MQFFIVIECVLATFFGSKSISGVAKFGAGVQVGSNITNYPVNISFRDKSYGAFSGAKSISGVARFGTSRQQSHNIRNYPVTTSSHAKKINTFFGCGI